MPARLVAFGNKNNVNKRIGFVIGLINVDIQILFTQKQILCEKSKVRSFCI
jgi:hypothetical protein